MAARVASRGQVLVVSAMVVVAGCAYRRAVPEAPPVPATSAPGLTVTLAWDAPVDLDLYVTEPGLESVYFANPKSAQGGVLARDARCADGARGARSEVMRWAAPPRGRYRVAVDFLESCGDRRVTDVRYRLVVDVDGRRLEHVGRSHVAERDPRAFEFSVGGDER